jgi:hypothetical protein
MVIRGDRKVYMEIESPASMAKITIQEKMNGTEWDDNRDKQDKIVLENLITNDFMNWK